MNPLQGLSDLGAWWQQVPSAYVIGACVGVPVLLGGLSALSRSRIQRNATTHGSARWATYAEVKRSGLSRDHGVVVGTMRGQTFYDDGPTHVFLCGPTRSTKGVCHLQPTLCTWRYSALILDPKDGENYTKTHDVREQFGPVAVFAPYKHPGVCINVADTIRFRTWHEVSDARAIAHSLTAPYKMEGQNSTSVHFRGLARWVLTAGLLHIGYAPPRPAPASLPLLLEFLTQHHKDLSACLRIMRTTRHTTHGVHPAIAQLATMVLNIASDKELSGVWTTSILPLEVYLDPRIAASTSTSTLSLTDLQLGPMPLSLYLLAPSPGSLGQLYPVYRAIIDIAMIRLMDRPIDTPAHRLLFCAEELPAYGYIDSINMNAGYSAGYGIKGFYVVQDLDQFEQVYGEKNAIWGNAETKIFHTPNNEKTAERISEYFLGEGTIAHPVTSRQDGLLAPGSVSHQHVGRRLLTTDEVMDFDLSKSLVRRAGTKPMALGKLGYDPTKKEAA